MEKMRMESADMLDKNIEKLEALFPNCITEIAGEDGKIRKAVQLDVFRQMFSGKVADGNESYEFTWVGKKAAIVEANKPIRKTLRPCIEESVDWDTTENLYIEGDNLEVLKLLQESYLGAVKMIYIDPPYNTGHDFIYPDSYIMDNDAYHDGIGYFDEAGNVNFRRENNSTAAKYHSDWCSMIYARLMLARHLLKEDGLILINMDENEIANLQKICAEIFGESNDLGTIIWDKRNPKGDAHGISCQHEYIVVYAKNKTVFTKTCSMQRPKKNASAMMKKARQFFEKIDDTYSLENANEDFQAWLLKQSDLSGGEKAYNRMDEEGKLYQAVSMSWPNKKKAPDDYFVPLIHPVTGKACPVPERGWRNPSATMKELLAENLILFGKDETTQPRRKYLLEENMLENIPSLLYYGGSDTALLNDLEIPFDTPKVVKICEEHIASFTKDEDIILDFFSGSATTAHAVMQQNAKDGGHRKFIMVQIPEPLETDSEAAKAGFSTICDIGKERLRKVGEKIRNACENPVDCGFRDLVLDETNMKDVYYRAEEYDQDMLSMLESNIKEDRTDVDLLFGCLLAWGLPLSKPYLSEKIDGYTIHSYNSGDLIMCFEENISKTVVEEIAKKRPLRAVFRDSSFADSSSKTNVGEIFRCLSPETSIKVI